MKLAALVYVRAGGQTLMLHRVKKAQDIHAGKWNGLGGKLEPGETPEACAIREVREESGLEIDPPQWRGLLTFPNFAHGEDWYAFVFVARSFRGTLIDSPEAWATPLAKYKTPADYIHSAFRGLDLPPGDQRAGLIAQELLGQRVFLLKPCIVL